MRIRIKRPFRINPEEAAQCAVFDWLRLYKMFDTAYHVANERRCSIQRGALLKRMGVLKGVSDICIPVPTNGYNGVYIELKAGKNKATKEQIAFIEKVKSNGYFATWVTGADEAIAIIAELYDIDYLAC